MREVVEAVEGRVSQQVYMVSVIGRISVNICGL